MKSPVSPVEATTKKFAVSESSAASSFAEQAQTKTSDTANNGDKHVFSDPAIAEHWRAVYEKAQYENRHRFDPKFTWTAQEEKKIVRKIDFRIMLLAWLMYCALDTHRRNINRAISDNMASTSARKCREPIPANRDRQLPEIGMNTNDFNYGQTIFLVCFLAAELPSGLIAKRVGADNYIPFAMISWSIVAGSQAFLHNKAGFYAIKALLGLLMGGFIPDVVLWLSYFYKSGELPVRLAWFWTGTSATNIFGSLLAGGVLQMRGIDGWSGWRWLFLIEGLLTLVVGIFSIVLMPAGPCQTRNWFRGKDGWFSEREELIMVNRLLRDDPSKGDMNNRQGVGPKLLFKVLKEWEQWPIYILGLVAFIPPSPPTTYLSLILRELGFSVFKANLLTIPSQLLFAINLILISMLSERLKERSIVSSLSNVWMLPWLAALVALGARASPWTRYALLTGILSYPYCHAVLVGCVGRNSNSVKTRAVSAALYNMLVQSGNIVSTNIYRDDDKPLYRRGNAILLAIACFNIVLFFAVKLFYVWRNSVRERRWAAMTPEEQTHYRLHSTDEGLKRLDFRFAH